MLKMRTIDQAAKELKEADPKSAMTSHAIRRLVITGTIQSVRVGSKYLLALENLENYLKGGSSYGG